MVNELTEKSEKLKLYFNMRECNSIEDVSNYFVNGLVKSLIEQVAPIVRVTLPEPAFTIPSESIEMYAKDLSNMLGAKTEKDMSQSQGFLQKKNSDTALGRRNLKKIPSRLMLKPIPVEVKKFEYKEDSQEIIFTEELPESSATQTSQNEIPKKRQKPNIKF